MALFNRRRSADPSRQAEAIDEFWSWWRDSGAAQTATALAQNPSQLQVHDLASRIKAIHPALAWELGPGVSAVHRLVVSSEGNPDLRAVAARWLRAASPADASWEYADARQPAADVEAMQLEVSGHRLKAREARVAARVRGAQVDVTIHHPVLIDLGEQERHLASFLLLDAALGEVDVEAWIGALSNTTVPLPDSITLAQLASVVREVAESCMDDGEPSWVLGQGSDPQGHEVLASAQMPLKSVLWPHLDTHVGIEVPYRARTENGWPAEESLTALRQFETHLSNRLAASGRLVGMTSSNGVRTLHFYVDGATPAADQLRAAVGGWDQGTVSVQDTKDPGWNRVAHLRM